MSRRNFILLIIILIILGASVVYFLYYRPSKAPGEGGEVPNFISRFNPFGNTDPDPVETPPTDISGYQPESEGQIEGKLRKVSSMPIAGFIVFNKERFKDVPVVVEEPASVSAEGSTEGEVATIAPPPAPKEVKPTAPPTEFAPSLRYVDRANGNIYQTFVDKIDERKFSETIIPKIYEAFFGAKGEYVIMRYLKDDGRTIETFVGNLPKEILAADTTEETKIVGTFLPENIRDLSISRDANSLFYLFNSGDDMVGTTLTLINDKKVQIFESPFTEWLSSWANNKMITLTTKPSSGVGGYVYAIDPANGKSFRKLFGGINGLTTLASPDGKSILYSDDSLSLYVYHTDTKISNRLGLRTLPEKCVWGNLSDVIYCAVPRSILNTRYPDAWYQGEISFSDQFWKIEMSTGNTTILLDPLETNRGEEIDGIKLALDESENYLFFVNKKDSFLWEFKIN